MTSKTEVSIKIPNLEELYCINCKVNPADVKDPIIKKSLFHCQIFTCRSLIFTVRCCIASPSIQNVGDLVHVIVTKTFFYKGKLQEHLARLNIQFSNPEPVHAKLYEACLKYTFAFKIAPFWNSVDKYFLHGPNFLSLPSGIDALEWDILYKADFSILEIIPMKISVSPLTLECLPLTPSIKDNFITNPNSTIHSIDLTLFQCPWVYVLPKLTKAKIVSVSRTLPKNCLFETYNDLRSHWKNMYAYRLPKTDHGMLFYEVVFPISPSDRFTYPEMCILFKKPEIVMSDNKTEIAKQFLKDLAANVHSVCGMVVQIGHLFPELDIEYSNKVIRKSNYNEGNSNQLTSPFFKTTSDSYIVKPSEEKINLSSMLKGSDKMTASMKTHSQKVISIMKNQHTKKMPLTQNNDFISKSQNQYVTPTYNKQGGRKTKSKEESFIAHLKSLQQNRTPIDNFDNIISYYDIPSMYPTDQDESIFQNSILLNDNEASDISKESGKLKLTFSHISSTTDLKNASNPNQTCKHKPVIKKVENVHYDLSNLKKKSQIMHGIDKSILEPETILETSKLYNQDQIVQFSNNNTNNFMKSSFSNPYCTAADNFFQNFKTEEFSKKLNKDVLQDTNCINKSKIPQQNLDTSKKLFNIEEQKLKETQTKFDDEFRSRLSNFDSYNLYQKDSLKSSFSSSYGIARDNLFQNLKSEDVSKKWSKDSLQDTNCINKLKISQQNLDASKKLFNIEEQKLKAAQTKFDDEFRVQLSNFDSHNLYQNSMKSTISNSCGTAADNLFQNLKSKDFRKKLNKDSLQDISCINKSKISQQNLDTSKKLFNTGEQKLCNFDSHNLYQKDLSKYDSERSTDRNFEKMHTSPILMFDSNSKIGNDSNSKAKGSFPNYEENVCNNSQYSPSILDTHNSFKKYLLLESNEFELDFKDNLKNSKKNLFQTSPSNSPILFADDELESMDTSENLPQCSPVVFDTCKEMQSKKISQIHASDNHNSHFVQESSHLTELHCSTSKLQNYNGDFTSILSESSDESDSDKYESYKQACTEALTFH